jgi:hypothetical protein
MAKALIDSAEVECLTLKTSINENHRLAQTAAAEAVERGVLVGELLARWKELLPHGQFETFTETHFEGSLRTAQIYMQAAKRLSALPKAQRSALLKQERSIAGLISDSAKGKPGGVSSTSLAYAPVSPGPASGEAAGSGGSAGGPGHGEETQHQAGESRDAHPSAGPPGKSGNLGKCPNCGGTKWARLLINNEAVEDWACAKCHHPHGEPAGDVNGEATGSQVRADQDATEGPVATIQVFADGWVQAFDRFWKLVPGALKRVIRDRIQETTRRGSGFQPPTVSEVGAYCAERNNGIDAEAFVDYYESVGWKVGKKKMANWKGSVRTWEKRKAEAGGKKNWLKDYLNRDKSKDLT